MNIGFDAKRYFHNQTGLGNYSRDLVNVLCDKYPDNNYFLFEKKPPGIDLPPNTVVVVPAGNKILWRAHGMINDMPRYKLDVFHGLSNELPWGKWPSGIKKIVTIHDVIFEHFPQHYALPDRLIYGKKTSHAVKTADIVVATSSATAKDLIHFYGVDEKKIRVVHQSCGPLHWKTYSEKDMTEFRNKRQLQQPFMLYVSSFEKRKNHMTLLKAFRLLKDKNSRLVLAGRPKETYADCEKFVKENGLEQQVLFITDISNEELPLLYRCAQSFIYPSMVEGFGIPLLEATCAGLPVAASGIDVFREIAPSGTLFFDVQQEENIAGIMKELMTRKAQDYSLHLKEFMPGRAAEKMHGIYTGNI